MRLLTLDENIFVAELGDGGLGVELERIGAVLALDAPFLLGCGDVGHFGVWSIREACLGICILELFKRCGARGSSYSRN